MALITIQGLAPPGGVATVTLSPGGDDQLTAVKVDPRTRLLTFEPSADCYLQWFGADGDAVDATQRVVLHSGGPNEVDVPGWGPNGPTFYLAGTTGTTCTVLAQRGGV